MYSIGIIVLGLVFGVSSLLCGYNLLPFLYGIAGFFTGLLIWYMLNPGSVFFSKDAFIIAAACAFIGLILHEFLMMAVAFFVVLYCVTWIGSSGSIQQVSITVYAIGAVAGIGAMLLLHKLFRPCMIILTAVVGAQLLTKFLLSLFWFMQQSSHEIPNLSQHFTSSLMMPAGAWNSMRVFYSILFFGLAIGGVIVQKRNA